jgi:hypothetical protein
MVIFTMEMVVFDIKMVVFDRKYDDFDIKMVVSTMKMVIFTMKVVIFTFIPIFFFFQIPPIFSNFSPKHVYLAIPCPPRNFLHQTDRLELLYIFRLITGFADSRTRAWAAPFRPSPGRPAPRISSAWCGLRCWKGGSRGGSWTGSGGGWGRRWWLGGCSVGDLGAIFGVFGRFWV